MDLKAQGACRFVILNDLCIAKQYFLVTGTNDGGTLKEQ